MAEEEIDNAISEHDNVMADIHQMTAIQGAASRVLSLASALAKNHDGPERFVQIAEEMDQAFLLLTLVSASLGINALAARVLAADSPYADAILEKLENDTALLKPIYEGCTDTIDALHLDRAVFDNLFS